MSTRGIAFAAGASLALLTPYAVVAQAPSSSEFSDEEIDTFAGAMGASMLVAEKWAPRIDAAESPEEMERLSEQSTQEMIGAVEASGMSLERYSEIYTAAQSDPALADRVLAALHKQAQDAPP